MANVNVESQINLAEVVPNNERKFGSATAYYPCKVKMQDGTVKVALFTENEIKLCIERAERNPEDIPQANSIWEAIFGA
jgi:hypothetical protein